MGAGTLAGRLSTALAEAGKGVSLKPRGRDAQNCATTLKQNWRQIAQAGQKEADTKAAMKMARTFARGDYSTALAEAGKALSLKPKDRDAQKLRDDIQAKLRAIALARQNEADYQSSMKNGRGVVARPRITPPRCRRPGRRCHSNLVTRTTQQLRDDAQAQLARSR